MIATRFGNALWVSSRGDGTVKRIDLDTNTITGSVAVGVQPESVMLTPSERTLVVSLRGSPATLAFVDTVNLTLLGTVPDRRSRNVRRPGGDHHERPPRLRHVRRRRQRHRRRGRG